MQEKIPYRGKEGRRHGKGLIKGQRWGTQDIYVGNKESKMGRE